jgi:hypothetical protein
MLTEDQRESNSNPSPSTGQSKQGLTSSHDGAPTPKPVEVWCVVRPDGFPFNDGDNKGETWADLCQKLGQSQAYLERVGYRCERRLLVPVGQTFADGVEACIKFLLHGNWFSSDGMVIAELRALSPAPEQKEPK